MIRAIVRARTSEISSLLEAGQSGDLESARLHDTRYYWEGEWHEAVIYDRSLLNQGQVIPGPSIVVEMDSTTLILPGFEARVDEIGNLLINPGNHGENEA